MVCVRIYRYRSYECNNQSMQPEVAGCLGGDQPDFKKSMDPFRGVSRSLTVIFKE